MRSKSWIVSVGVLLCLLNSTLADELKYNIDEIPTVTVWHDADLTFLVHWEGHTAESFDVLASPEPFGPLSIRPSTETGTWKFEYLPNEDDVFPFHVIITATDADGSTSQAFDVVPMAKLKPEQTVFQIENHTRPVYVEKVVRVEEQSPTEVPFNNVNRFTRDVTIIGEEVIFDTELEDDDKLHEYSGLEDLRQMDIIAEKLIIRMPLDFPETTVNIWAREMIVEPGGSIRTMPRSLTSPPPNPQDPGVTGLDAGNINLHLGAFTAPEGATSLFDLSGGAGQQGGHGSYGTNGDTYQDWTPFPMSCSNSNCTDCITEHTPANGAGIIYGGRQMGLGFPDQCWWGDANENHHPTDGLPASPGGKPGYGGRAGDLTSNIDVSAFVVQNRGATAEARTYRGGFAGRPTNWVKIKFGCDSSCGFHSVWNVDEGTTVAGADATDPAPDPSPYPETGITTTEGHGHAWLHPQILRKVIRTSRAAYLDSRLDEAREELVEWSGLIKEYMDDVDVWEAADETSQVELGEAYDQMQILLTQMDSGNDYFNNPAGWVPMLSFEVNAAIFDQEIEHALNALYLTHWIKKNAEQGIKTLETLEATQDQLKKEMEEAVADYDRAVNAIPIIQAEGSRLEVRTMDLQRQLMVLEQVLIAQAKENLAPPWWEVALRTGAKTAGMICQMIPVYQPYLGSIGKGISMLSNFDADQPWESVMDMGTGGIDIFSGCMDTMYNSSVTSQQNQIKKVDPNDPLSIKISNLKQIRNSSMALSAGLTDLRGYLSNLEAPADEVAAELEKLKSESDEWKGIVEEIEVLVEKRGKLVEEMVIAMRDVSILPDLIVLYALQLDAIGKEINRIDEAIDDRAVVYIEEMEERANARLLKYHYYMAKAYEYRLLKPYTNPLDLQELREKLEDIGGLFDPDFIDSDNYTALKSVYQEMLSEVAQEIFADYNANRPEVSAPVRFELSREQLEAINRGAEVVINLMDMGLFSAEDENIRIVNFTVFQKQDGTYEITTEPIGDGYGSTAYVDIKIEHSGVSLIKSNGDVYKFEHYTEGTTNPIVWGARYDPVNDVVDPIEPSAASQSLLQALLPDIDLSDLLIYSRPSAWADLRISKTENDNNDNIRITSLKLELVYDYSQKNEDLGLVEVDVRVSKKDYDDDDELVSMEANFRPFFSVEMPDINERQGARGRFLRFYQSSATDSVEVTAQPEYGKWKFVNWTDGDGTEIEDTTTVNIDLYGNQLVFAHYELDTYSLPNHAPTAPVLVSPEDGARNVEDKPTLVWEASTDPDQDPLSYFVNLCDNAAFSGCEPVTVTSTQTQELGQAAVNGFPVFVALALAFALVGFAGRRRRLAWVLIVLLSLGLLVTAVSCSDGGGGTSGPTDYTPDEPLDPDTTYYWQVTASDGRGGLATSDTWSFKTE